MYKRILLLFIAALLTACGGGGGGDGGFDGGGNIERTTVLADEDELQITQETFATSAFAQSFAVGFGLGIDGAPLTASAAPVETDAAETLGSFASRAVASLTDDVTDVRASVIQSCTISGTVDVIETADDIDYRFSDCEGFPELGFPGVINGRLAIFIDSIDDSPPEVGATFRILIRNFSIEDDDEIVEIDTDFDGAVRFDLDVTYIEVDLSTDSFITNDDGDESELLDYDYEVRVTDTRTREDFSGGLDGYGFDGVVVFYTTETLVLNLITELYTSGVIVIEGANNAEIRISANGTEFADVDIDEDGDGDYETNISWSWDDDILDLVDSLEF